MSVWQYVSDPMFAEGDEVPGFGVIGGFPVAPGGAVGDFVENPDYRPSPRALGMPLPCDAVEDLIQRAATGYAGDGEVFEALWSATLLIPRSPDDDVFPVIEEAGRELVPVFTSRAHSAGEVAPITLAELEPLLWTRSVTVNPGGPVELEIAGSVITERMSR